MTTPDAVQLAVHMSPAQRAANLDPILVYLASLAVSPGRTAPFTKDEDNAFARLQLAYYDDLRGLLSTWRWMHRWLALLLLALTAVHVVAALRFGGVDFSVLLGEVVK